jgi:hypothetical protein
MPALFLSTMRCSIPFRKARLPKYLPQFYQLLHGRNTKLNLIWMTVTKIYTGLKIY